MCSVVYMQFLAFESGRKAIKDLVEFEPTQAEDMITILLSELVAYGFLREQFTGDLRERRLAARDAGYRRDVPELYQLVTNGNGPAMGRRARHRQRDDAAVCTRLPGRYGAACPCAGIRLTRCWVYAQPDPTEGDGHERGQR